LFVSDHIFQEKILKNKAIIVAINNTIAGAGDLTMLFQI